MIIKKLNFYKIKLINNYNVVKFKKIVMTIIINYN